MSNQQNSWHTFLRQQGGNIVDDHVVDFGDAAGELSHTTDGTVLVPLSHLALLRASGTDCAEFLQGQTSNDVRLVDDGHHQISSYSTAKGRMLALFTLFLRDNDFYLHLPQELLEAVQRRLTMFVLRSDVKLTNASDEFPSFGISGPQATSLLQQALGGYPTEVGETLTIDGITLLHIPGQHPRFVCFGAPERLTTLWQRLATEAMPAGATAWDLLDIRAGIPNLATGTVEAFVPQMVNLQLINGVNFKKGCYPGQEVVARMQYLGKLKRRMYRASVDSAELPSSGTALYSPVSESGQGAGKVVRAAPSPRGGYELLVVAEVSCAEVNELYLQDEHGARLTLLDLPYKFEPDDK